LIELNAQTGKLVWKLPVGVRSGHENDGLLTEDATPASRIPLAETSKAFEASLSTATGEMVAVYRDTGKVEWDVKLPSSPYGAATVTNNVVFTTTYSGYLYAFAATTGAVLLKTPLSAGSNAPATIDGEYVIVEAGVQIPKRRQALIIAGKLGADGKLPDTVP
jgi:outer membrane protein assembly factor BamB